MPAPAQDVLWSPLADPAVVILTQPPEFLETTSACVLDGIGGRRGSAEGSYVVFCGEAHDPTAVLFLPESRPGEPVAALIPLDADTPGRIEALIRLWRAQQGRSVPPDTRMTMQQRRRLRLMMQAADGRANGASYREIAAVLFGRERVASELWKTSALRDMVIGLVEGGAALIGGGYLHLLRHRRRS